MDTNERTCALCGSQFTARPGKTRKNLFCSRACSNRSANWRETVQHRMVRAPNHPVAPPSGTVSAARIALYDKIGPGTHACHWCGTTVVWMPGKGLAPGALIADHLNFDAADDSPENLVPACNSCNKRRTPAGTHRPVIAAGETHVVLANGQRMRAVEKRCASCDSVFLVGVNQVNAGKGNYCSLSCARRAYWAGRRRG